MKNIIKAEDLPENEKVYLRKDWLGWRVVEPIKNEDGTTNWFNLITGGKKNLAILIILLIFLGLIFLGVKELIQTYKDYADNPCGYCSNRTGVDLTPFINYGDNQFYKIEEKNGITT